MEPSTQRYRRALTTATQTQNCTSICDTGHRLDLLDMPSTVARISHHNTQKAEAGGL